MLSVYNEISQDLIRNARDLRDQMVRFAQGASGYSNLTRPEIEAINEIARDVCIDGQTGRDAQAIEESAQQLLANYAARITQLHTISQRQELYRARSVSTGFMSNTTVTEPGPVATDVARIYYKAVEPAKVTVMLSATLSLLAKYEHKSADLARTTGQLERVEGEKKEVQDRLLDAVLPVPKLMDSIQSQLLAITNGSGASQSNGLAHAAASHGTFATTNVVRDDELERAIERSLQAFSPQRQDVLLQIQAKRNDGKTDDMLEQQLNALQGVIIKDMCAGSPTPTAALLAGYEELGIEFDTEKSDTIQQVAEQDITLARATQRVLTLFQTLADATSTQRARAPLSLIKEQAVMVQEKYNETHEDHQNTFTI